MRVLVSLAALLVFSLGSGCEGAGSSDGAGGGGSCAGFNEPCEYETGCCDGFFCMGYDDDTRCWAEEGTPCGAHSECQPEGHVESWDVGCFDGECYDCRRTADTGKRPCAGDGDCCPGWYCSFVTGGGWCEEGGCTSETCSGCQYIGSENCCYHCSNDRCVQSCSF